MSHTVHICVAITCPLQVLPRITLSAEAPAPGPAHQISTAQAARVSELVAALGPASAPAQGPVTVQARSACSSRRPLDAVVESYIQGAQATAPAGSLTAAVEEAARAAAAIPPSPAAAAASTQPAGGSESPLQARR